MLKLYDEGIPVDVLFRIVLDGRGTLFVSYPQAGDPGILPPKEPLAGTPRIEPLILGV